MAQISPHGTSSTFFFAETFEDHQVFDPGLLHRCTVALGQRDVLSRPERAARHLAHGDTARVGGVFERGDEHLGRAFYHGRFGYLVDDGVQQRDERVGRLVPFVRHPALFGRAVDSLVVELLLGGVEREHQVENLFVDHFGTAVGLVDLVDYHDGLLAQRQRLCSTNRVWGMVPSKASTSSSTPSHMFSTRSTSPPKSAWPGVSMMLIL